MNYLSSIQIINIIGNIVLPACKMRGKGNVFLLQFLILRYKYWRNLSYLFYIKNE